MSKNEYNGAERYRPLAPWGYVGYMLLFMIPVVGWLFLSFFTFNDYNINRRGFARSYWCYWLLLIVGSTIVLNCGLVPQPVISSGIRVLAKDLASPLGAYLDEVERGAADVVSGVKAPESTDVDQRFRWAMASHEAFFNDVFAIMHKSEIASNDPRLFIDFTACLMRYAQVKIITFDKDITTLSLADSLYSMELLQRLYTNMYASPRNDNYGF